MQRRRGEKDEDDDAYDMSHEKFDELLYNGTWKVFEDREEMMRKFDQRVKAARTEEKEGVGSEEEEEGDAEDQTSLQALTAHPKRSSSQPQAGSCREEELRRMDLVDAYEISHDEFDEWLDKEGSLFEVREEVMRRFFRRVNAEEEEGDAEDPPVTIQRLLLKFCGKWSDGRSEYEVTLDPGKLNSCAHEGRMVL